MSVLQNFHPDFIPAPMVGDAYIETGTGSGSPAGDGCSMQHALKQPFRFLHSIEVCEANYLAACRNLDDDSRMRLHKGSSPDILPTIMVPELRTTFWLDAHWQCASDEEIDPRYGQCPLLDELRAIKRVPWVAPPAILIDDSYIFATDSWWLTADVRFKRREWPTIQQIIDTLGLDWRYTLVRGILYCWK